MRKSPARHKVTRGGKTYYRGKGAATADRPMGVRNPMQYTEMERRKAERNERSAKAKWKKEMNALKGPDMYSVEISSPSTFMGHKSTTIHFNNDFKPIKIPASVKDKEGYARKKYSKTKGAKSLPKKHKVTITPYKGY